MNCELHISHNGGFFFDCTTRLRSLCSFLNANGRLPETIDWKNQFGKYKSNKKSDLTPLLFSDHNNTHIETPNQVPVTNTVTNSFQWHHNNYSTAVPFNLLKPFIKKYFEPSELVKGLVADFETEHYIDYSNTIAVYYRGLDKRTEVIQAPYDVFINKAEEILLQNPTAKFLVQTDETEFKDAFFDRFPNNSFCNEKMPTKSYDPTASLEGSGIHFSTPMAERPFSAARLLGAAITMSKCKWLITSTSNVALWSVLYRGNSDGVFQMRKNRWIRTR